MPFPGNDYFECLMLNPPADPIGVAWLAQTFSVPLSDGIPVVSGVGGRRATEKQADGSRREFYPENMRPAPHFAAHLQFHLRHEIAHLGFLARLFEHAQAPEFIQQWIDAEPTGQYARRAAFLFEWLTGRSLVPPAKLSGGYVDVVDAQKMVAASPGRAVNVSRWRVRDNLPGSRDFCPMVFKLDEVNKASNLDVAKLFEGLVDEFGNELLMRAAVWMTLRESRASFTIEGESDKLTRIKRFARVMEQRTAQGDVPLNNQALASLQREILGEVTTLAEFGIRQSPVFIGEVQRYQEVIHYVAPPPDHIQAMLDGLQTFLDRTQGQSPVMRCAVAAFGFVYIHPLADGNGRVHRFLVNDILRRDAAVPEPVILPISAVISADASEQRRYSQVLDRVSKPLMSQLSDYVQFEATQTRYPDGVVSNFTCSGYGLFRSMWSYLDLGPHVIYLSSVIERTLREQMREESRYLRMHARARGAIKEIVEMPDVQVDRVLRSIEQNNGVLSGVLAKEMPVLAKDGIWDAILAAVREVAIEYSSDNEIVRNYPTGRP